MKKAIALALSLAMVLGLAACGGSSSTTTTTTTSTSSASSTQTSDASTPAATPVSKETAVLATGGTTGTYYAVGSAMATTLNPLLSYTELNITSTGASKANVLGVTDGEYDLAIVQSDVVSYAHAGDNLFDAPETTSLWVAGLYNETVQITARGGITDVAELRGKTVCVGDAGSGTEFNANQVLEAYGMTQADINVVYASFGEASEMLKNGQIDAAFTVAGAPTTAITELATSGMDFSMVSLSDEAVSYLTANYPFLVQENLPAGTYDGVDTETVCVAVQAVLVASEDMSTEAVYELTKAIFENLDDLSVAHAKFQLVSVDSAISDAIPMHPGAEQYYKEIGVL